VQDLAAAQKLGAKVKQRREAAAVKDQVRIPFYWLPQTARGLSGSRVCDVPVWAIPLCALPVLHEQLR